MTVKIVRMVNGEDVIADVKEVRKDEDTPGAVAYVFDKPFTVQIIDHTQSQMLFETPGDTTSPSPQKINDLELKFYPYAPLALKDGVVAAVQHVALIYDPHPSVMEKYLELTKAMDFLAKDSRTIFIGQAVEVPGTAMSNTLKEINTKKLIELPVAEEMQMGMTIGLALNGNIPVSIYPRWNFLLLAANQLINHLNLYFLHLNTIYLSKKILPKYFHF